MTPKQAAALYTKTGNIRRVQAAAKCDFYSAKKLIVAGGGKLLGRRRTSRLSREEITSLYADHSVSQIAKLNGTSNSIILRALRAAGVTLRSRGGGKFHNKPIKHGFAARAIAIGMNPHRYIRLLVVRKLGASCAECGEADIRVLDVNHVNGVGVVRNNGRRSFSALYAKCLAILAGETEPHINVLCCNCNRRHEYLRGRLLPIPAEFFKEPI